VVKTVNHVEVIGGVRRAGSPILLLAWVALARSAACPDLFTLADGKALSRWSSAKEAAAGHQGHHNRQGIHRAAREVVMKSAR